MFRKITGKLVGKSGRKGYTLAELMSVVAIIAVVLAIAIPSVIAIHRSLTFRQNNDYAKSVFMAAQANLSNKRSDGELVELAAAEGAFYVPEGAAGFPATDWSNEYVYTTSRGEKSAAFDLVLPANSIDSKVRDGNILIEYNPYTGNVYSVFYTRDNGTLSYADENSLTRDADARRKIMLGYYCGSGLSSSEFQIETEEAELAFVNGEEGVIRAIIPIPDAYKSNPNSFVEGLNVEFIVEGKNSENESKSMTLLAKFGGALLDDANKWSSCEIKEGKVIVSYVLDSLKEYGSFANLAYKDTAKERYDEIADFATVKRDAKNSTSNVHITSMSNAADFTILPGSNVSIEADIMFESSNGKNGVEIGCGVLEDVNPMLGSLDKSAVLSNKYVIGVENGRNLQNLNAIAPAISEKVTTVSFSDDIYWNKTVNYYNDKYANGGTYKNYENEAPARGLPYFVPVNNEVLFGSAQFIYPDAAGDLGKQLRGAIADLISDVTNGVTGLINRIFGTSIDQVRIVTDTDSDTPTLTDELDTNAANHATVDGGGHAVYYLNVNTGKYKTSLRDTAYYAGNTLAGDSSRDKFTGLFGYVNTEIHDVYVVNPLIKGANFTGTNSADQKNNPAVGALVGAAGWNTYLYNCGAYIDKHDVNFNQRLMTQTDYDRNANNDQSFYGVSGCGSVGGLVGYAKSHTVLTEELTAQTAKQNHIAYTNCFASLFVSGRMRGCEPSMFQQSGVLDDPNHFGYTNGVGGLVGNSELTNFYGCYSGSNVKADGVYIQYANGIKAISNMVSDMLGAKKLDLPYDGRTSMGAGGLVGTSHGSVYTNCFTSGNIEGKNTNSTYISALANVMNTLGIKNESGKLAGTAGFVGVMSYSESFTYGNGKSSADDVAGISQKSVFSSCYSAGTTKVHVDGKSQDVSENFTGANARINSDISMLSDYWSGNFYDVYAPLWFSYADNATKNGVNVFRKTSEKVAVDHTRSYMYDLGPVVGQAEGKVKYTTDNVDGKSSIDLYTLPYQSYVFKDSYYLSNYSDTSYSNEFGRCGLPIAYEYLTDLTYYHNDAVTSDHKKIYVGKNSSYGYQSGLSSYIDDNSSSVRTGWVDQQIAKIKENSVFSWANALKNKEDKYKSSDAGTNEASMLTYGGIYFGDWLYEFAPHRSNDDWRYQVFYRYEGTANAGSGAMLARIIMNQSARMISKGEAISEVDILFQNAYPEYHTNFKNTIPDLYRIYVKLFSLGFKGTEWNKASTSTTHGYELIDTNTVYPFSKLENRDYYGNWPSKPMACGLVYYELYDDGTYGYYFDRESTSTLDNGKTVVSDGYAIATANSNDNVTVNINGKDTNISGETQVTATYYTGTQVYFVHFIPWSAIDAASTNSEFYSKVTIKVNVTHDGDTSTESFTMYFNPNVALSQVNPVSDGTGIATTAEKPASAPDTIYIRTARQFASMKNLTNWWGDGYNYVQMINIDASAYDGSSYGADAGTVAAYARNNSAVGTSTTPFNANYNGHNGYVDSAILGGFTGGNSCFGYVGEQGKVSYLTLNCTGSCGSSSADNFGVLVAENHGEVSNITATADSATLNAKTNAGIIVGLNKAGKISDCTVTGSVSSNAANVGLIAGATEGIYDNKGNLTASGSVSNCTVEVAGISAPNANAGAFAGKLDGVEVRNANVTVSGDITAKVAGGVAGEMSKVTLSGAEVAVNAAINGTELAGGFAGNCSKSSTMSDMHLTVAPDVAITAPKAGGVAGNATALNVSNNSYIDLNGSVNGSQLAGGAMATMDGGYFNGFNVNLGSGSAITSESGTAAGFAAVCGGRATDCNVNSNGSAISGAKAAAGFAGTLSSNVDSCNVRGNLNISSDGDAAGFAVTVESTSIVNFCKVTPVLSDSNDSDALKQAYRASGYDRLTVDGANRAAGFAVEIKGATVESCDALGTIGGNAAEDSTPVNAGFAIDVAKSTSIIKCIANTVVHGTAFIENNNGSVFNSYAWCDVNGTVDTVGEDESVYFACYIGVRDGETDARNQKISVFLPDNSREAVQMPLNLLTPELLNGAEQGIWGEMATYDAYPFSAMTPPEYTYPMLRVHLGDWANMPQNAYGIVYYEVMEDGYVNMKLWDMNNDGFNYGFVSYDENGAYNGFDYGAGTFFLDNINSGNSKKIAGTGYALFYADPAQIREVGDKKLADYSQELTEDYLKAKYGLDSVNFNGSGMVFGSSTAEDTGNVFVTFMENYTMTIISEDAADVGKLNVKGINGDSYTVMPGFARDARPATDTHGTYDVRTGNQFENVGGIDGSGYTVNQTHNIRLAKDANIGTGAAGGNALNGTYDGKGNAIFFKELEEGEDGNIRTGIFLDLAENAAVKYVTVQGAELRAELEKGQSVGVIANSVNANSTLSNITVTLCNVNYNNVDDCVLTVNETTQILNDNAGILAGSLNGANDKKITVKDITLNGSDVKYVNVHENDVKNDVRNGYLNVGGIAGVANYTDISNVKMQKIPVTVTNDDGTTKTVDYLCDVSYDADCIRNNALNIGGIVGVMGEGSTVKNSTLTDTRVTYNEARSEADTKAFTEAQEPRLANSLNIGGIVGTLPAQKSVVTSIDAVEFKDSAVYATTDSLKVNNHDLKETDNGYITVIFSAGDIVGNAGSFNVVNSNVTDSKLHVIVESGRIFGGAIAGYANVNNRFSGTVDNSGIGSEATNPVTEIITRTKDNIIHTGGAVGVFVDNNEFTGTVKSTAIDISCGNSYAPVGGAVGQQGAGKVNAEVIDAHISAVTEDISSVLAGGITGYTASGSVSGKVTAPVFDISANTGTTNYTDTEVEIGGAVGMTAAAATVTACEVSDVTVYKGGHTLGNIGGIVGQSNGASISNVSSTSMNLSFTPKSGTTGDNSIGGIVGDMLGGSITDSNISDGGITLKGNKNDKYYVGGAVGKEDNSGASYTNVSVTVDVDAAFAGSNSDTTVCPSTLGTVGKFIGKVNNGSFNTCSGLGSSSAAYQFLGEISVSINTAPISNPYVSNLLLNSNGIIAERIDSTENSYRQHGGSLMLTKVDAASASTRHIYSAELKDCLYTDVNGALNRQEYSSLYYYNKTNAKDYKTYVVNTNKLSSATNDKYYFVFDRNDSYGMYADGNTLAATQFAHNGNINIYYGDSTITAEKAIWHYYNNYLQNYVSGKYINATCNTLGTNRNVGLSDSAVTIQTDTNYGFVNFYNYNSIRTLRTFLSIEDSTVQGRDSNHMGDRLYLYEVTLPDNYWRADFAYNSCDQLITHTPI